MDHDLEVTVMESTQAEEQKEKIIKRNEDRERALWEKNLTS